jgi:hypothetical protein
MGTVCLGKVGYSIPIPITARASDVGSQGSSSRDLQKMCSWYQLAGCNFEQKSQYYFRRM